MGYTQAEIDDTQARWRLRFPPDLVALLREHRPLLSGPNAFDWVTSDPDDIRKRLEWPFESFWFDVERNDVWWQDWGEKPAGLDAQRARLTEVFAAAPKLIPLWSHRYLPEEPHASGNPVFSVYQTDVIHYGADLADWLARERGGFLCRPWPALKEIRFWSQAVRINDAPWL